MLCVVCARVVGWLSVAVDGCYLECLVSSWLFVLCSSLFVVCCLSCVDCCTLVVACCFLFVVCCLLLFVAYCCCVMFD